MAENTIDSTTKIQKTKAVAGYLFLPRLLPRFRDLFASGFSYFAFLIASVYQCVRILPANHPYTNPSNIGRFGVRKVVIEAANNIKLNRQNIDQVIIFFAIIAGILVLGLQFIALLVMFLTDAAYASGVFNGLFSTPNPGTDIAFLLLDHTFGIPDFFGSSINATLPTPFHRGIQSLFQFYNYALLVVGIIIFVYYVIVVIAETAMTGTPFGKRFAHIYAPLRLVIAIGLLIPLNWGFNSSQYITLAVAKMGSGLATNGWLTYNRGLANAFGVNNSSLLARPQTPRMDELAAFMTVVHACRESYCIGKNAAGATNTCAAPNGTGLSIQPYLTIGNNATNSSAINYIAARTVFADGDITITFGHHDPNLYQSDTGYVRPYCGKMSLPINSLDGSDPRGVSAEVVQESYFNFMTVLWWEPRLRALGERFARAKMGEHGDGVPASQNDCWKSGLIGDGGNCATITYEPPSSAKESILNTSQALLNGRINGIYNILQSRINLMVSPEILRRGWGGAGIAYNDLADVNGKFFEAVYTLPSPKEYPMIMQEVQKAREQQDGQSTVEERFNPNLAEGREVPGLRARGDMVIAQTLNESYQYWVDDQTTNEAPATQNIFFDAIGDLFGIHGLFCMIDPFPGPTGTTDDFRDGCGVNTHPMVQLIGLGKGIVTAAINNLGNAMAFAALGGATTSLNAHIGAASQAMSGFYLSIATIGLGVGFTLYYVVPFLPFIYFFFAVGGWVKSIFEAMVGAPLWALAHLRIDGEGLMGQSAMNGYLLILEIFIRPILTVFGLVGSFVVFTAMAHILHEVFTLIIVNLSGYEPITAGSSAIEAFRRNVIDEFFYTIIYAIIIYMMATASFKMIDMVPNFITRWLGQNVSSFGDGRDDPTQGMVQYAAIGGSIIGGQVGGALTSASRGAGQLVDPAVAQAMQASAAEPDGGNN